MDRATFVDRWSKSLELGSAAAFIGAGLSQGAGYPGWKQLLRDIAAELGLDIEEEHDLAAVAQFSINRAVGKRNKIAGLIANEFPPRAQAPEPFRILARLPLRHVWTTNYDSLPETAWRSERKLLDVKSRNEDLGVEKPWAHAILYKMHGSVDHPADVVIAKDDYELYRSLRPGFLQLLTGDLISRRFLFLGFSFTDPNLAHLFGAIRESFRENGPEHYAIVRRPQRGDGPGAKKRHKTDGIRYRLWVEDLQRYGIQCVEIDGFEEIHETLTAVEARLAQRSIMVSGSFPDPTPAAEAQRRDKVEAVARGVGRLIALRKKRLVSGFGLVVGSASLTGALGEILAEDTPNLDKSVMLRPFPQDVPQGMSMEEFRKQYRAGLIQQAGACIAIAGIRNEGTADQPELVDADGVLLECRAAAAAGRPVIPIGAMGGAAARIWEEAQPMASPWPSEAEQAALRVINDPASAVEAIITSVDRLLQALDKLSGS